MPLHMRFIIHILLLMLFIIPCKANYDTMPAPPPSSPYTQSKDDDKPRVKRGIHWYRSPQCETAAQQLQLAFKYYNDGRYRKAANSYQALVYAWPDSPEAPQAQLALAKVQEIRQRFAKAFDEYQYLFEYYPGQFDYQEISDRQFKIANYMMKTPKASFLFFPGFDAPERALPMYEKIIKNAPTGGQAATAQLNIGIIHELNEEEEDAVTAYETFQNRYSDANLAAQASFREAHCLVKIHTNRPNDEDACNAARAALVQFITTYPGHEKVEEARGFLKDLNDKQAKRAYDLARYYQTIAHRPKAAIVAYEDFLRKYPNTTLATSAKQQLAILNKETKTNENK
ncbi:MAG: tetratricopeptide repeat protein [bacterium]|jgi:outer membrane protein assembly factor BamD (BamD/ComL family)